MPVIEHREYVDRTTQRTDTLYVGPDDIVWFTPDGIGRVALFNDADQTEPMTTLEARHETGITGRTCYVEHVCDYERCDMADGATRCRG